MELLALHIPKMVIKGYGADYDSSFQLLDIQKALDDTSAENHRKNPWIQVTQKEISYGEH